MNLYLNILQSLDLRINLRGKKGRIEEHKPWLFLSLGISLIDEFQRSL